MEQGNWDGWGGGGVPCLCVVISLKRRVRAAHGLLVRPKPISTDLVTFSTNILKVNNTLSSFVINSDYGQ